MIEEALAQILNAFLILLICAAIVNLVVLATFLIACLVHDHRARRASGPTPVPYAIADEVIAELGDEAINVMGGGSRGPGESA